MNSRHLIPDIPTEPIHQMNIIGSALVRSRPRRPATPPGLLILIGNPGDQHLSQTIKQVHNMGKDRPHIAELLRFETSDPAAFDKNLIRLAAYLHLLRYPGFPLPLRIVTSWQGEPGREARLLPEALVHHYRNSAPKTQVLVTAPRGITSNRSSLQQAEPRAASEIKDRIIADTQQIDLQAVDILTPALGIVRNHLAAARAVARLRRRHPVASQRMVAEHLRAYGYTNERNQPGVWSEDQVRRLAAQVES